MHELIIIGIFIIYISKLILKHNLFISTIKLKIKFLGLHIEIHSIEKKTTYPFTCNHLLAPYFRYLHCLLDMGHIKDYSSLLLF